MKHFYREPKKMRDTAQKRSLHGGPNWTSYLEYLKAGKMNLGPRTLLSSETKYSKALLSNCSTSSTDVYVVPCGYSYSSRARKMGYSKAVFWCSQHLQFQLSRPTCKDQDKIFHAGWNCLWKVSAKKASKTAFQKERVGKKKKKKPLVWKKRTLNS